MIETAGKEAVGPFQSVAIRQARIALFHVPATVRGSERHERCRYYWVKFGIIGLNKWPG